MKNSDPDTPMMATQISEGIPKKYSMEKRTTNKTTPIPKYPIYCAFNPRNSTDRLTPLLILKTWLAIAN